MNEQEIYYTIALTRIGFFNIANALMLYRELGSGSAVYEHRNDIGDILPDCSPRLIEALRDWSEPLKRAAAEMEFIGKHHIQALTYHDTAYPQRLRECADAPVILYYKGTADLNQQYVVNIIGTRQCTTYGADLIHHFVQRLHTLCPQLLIVSGLAYGVDIHAHREALQNGYETVGVLAHGLDQLYPHHHRDTAAEMVKHGGLLTEFMTQTNADKGNFVRRNRIVAGMSDACILVESAAKGGGLITAGISRSYDRDVFAFPGAVGAPYSEGCNQLIRDNGAALITCADDFVKAMGWQKRGEKDEGKGMMREGELFPDLTPEEQTIVSVLLKTNDLQVNILSVQTNLPVNKVTALLFSLEMKGVVKALAGGMWHLR